jgi:cysteine desulfurase
VKFIFRLILCSTFDMLALLTMQTIYFDHNATTPLDPMVLEAMLPYLNDVWGNPSSIHHVGLRARAALDSARDRAALVLGCKPSEVVFTSGGTEANNLAILGSARSRKNMGRHLITSVIEHPAVLRCFDLLAAKEGFEVTYLPVDGAGRVSVEQLMRSLRPDTMLVSIMAANNEIGTIQPVAEMGLLCRERGILFHTDAVQWFGKEPVVSVHQFNADLVSVCAHKFHGPKGAGLLFIRSPLLIESVFSGGGHEHERRPGTENLPAIIGLVEALERFVPTPVFKKNVLATLSCRLLDSIVAIPGVVLVGFDAPKLTNTVSFLVEGADSISLLAALDLEGICASAGSACSAGSLSPSHVISALGKPQNLANALVRFSLGRSNTIDEVDFTRKVLPSVIGRAVEAKFG